MEAPFFRVAYSFVSRLKSVSHDRIGYLLMVSILSAAFFVFVEKSHAQEIDEPTARTVEAVGTTDVAPIETTEAVPIERTQVERNERPLLKEGVQNRIINLARNVINRINAAIDRLDNIANRLDTRIQKLEQSGVDVSRAETKLIQTKRKIETVKEKAATLPSITRRVVGSSNPHETVRGLKVEIGLIKNLLIEIKGDLNETIRLLKLSIEGETPETSTSTENAPQIEGGDGGSIAPTSE